MSDAFCSLYAAASPGETAQVVIPLLGRCGYQLKHPVTQELYIVDDEGDQYAQTEEAIQGFLRHFPAVSIQLWSGPSDNLFCTFRADPARERLWMGLDGKSLKEKQDLISVLDYHVRDLMNQIDLYGVVADFGGGFAEVDWDGFFHRGVDIPVAPVAYLLCSGDCSKQLPASLRDEVHRSIGSYRVYRFAET